VTEESLFAAAASFFACLARSFLSNFYRGISKGNIYI
jgi:hypothetical protein